jgi:hypothetical protein
MMTSPLIEGRLLTKGHLLTWATNCCTEHMPAKKESKLNIINNSVKDQWHHKLMMPFQVKGYS